jgi:hypothetical protein
MKKMRRQPHYPNDDEVDRDNVIEQSRLNQDEDTGYQGDDRLNQERMQIHDTNHGVSWLRCIISYGTFSMAIGGKTVRDKVVEYGPFAEIPSPYPPGS